MMYMSGRALHPISVNLAQKLQEEFAGELLLSFSAGADAFNISDLYLMRVQDSDRLLRSAEAGRLHEAEPVL